MRLFHELQRRNVFKVAGVYLVGSWLLIKLISGVSAYLQLTTPYDTLASVLFAIGFPIACLYAWAFEITPEGLKRTDDVHEDDSITDDTGRKLNVILVILLFIVLAFILYLQFSEKSPLAKKAKIEILALPK